MSPSARRRTQRSSRGARPVASATDTRVPAATGPAPGLVQRTRASTPTTAPEATATTGWYSSRRVSSARAVLRSAASAQRPSTSSPSARSKTRTCPRPACFAAWTAVSARRRRSLAPIPDPAGVPATPTDADTCTDTPSTTKGSARTCRRSCAVPRARPSSLSSHTTANSSAPKRPTRARPGTAASSRAPTAASSSSPTACPRELLTMRKWSNATSSTAVDPSAVSSACASRSTTRVRFGSRVRPSRSSAVRSACSARRTSVTSATTSRVPWSVPSSPDSGVAATRRRRSRPSGCGYVTS
jgi:hypothetical protein